MNPKIKLSKNLAKTFKKHLSCCNICPRNCSLNRLEGERGYCGTDKDMIIYNTFPHHGEEPGISGQQGSGTIFFSGCNLKCVYCQNYKFSHAVSGKKASAADLATTMLSLQKRKVHNINLVTPTHFLPQIINALAIAFENGLDIPIVYNTSGYEKKEIIQQLAGLVDIYLTDLKYIEPSLSKQYSNAPEYPKFAVKSLLEMNRQMASPGSTEISSPNKKLLKKGLIVRHLILPNYTQESKNLLSWVKDNLPEALISVMFQYRPYFKANSYSQINQSIDYPQYQEIKKFTEEIKIKGWIQDYNPQEDMAGLYFKPDI